MQQRFEYYRQTYCKKLYDISRNTNGGRMEDSIFKFLQKKNNKVVINGVDHAEIDDIINFIRTT